MSAFGGGGYDSSYGSNQLSGADKEKGKQAILQQVQMAMFQELLKNTSDTCFKKCVYKPSTSLSSSERGCLERCTDRYLETYKFVTKEFFQKAGSM